MAIKERFSEEDEEFDELAIDNYSQQGNGMDGSDNSVDEDYIQDVGDEDEEITRPIKRRKLPSYLRDEAPRAQYSPNFVFDEQLHTPRPTRSPSTTKESQTATEYCE
jgi:hypothetical protein